MKKLNYLFKNIEAIIGIFLLIPPIMGVISFTMCVMGIDNAFSSLELSPAWSAIFRHYYEGLIDPENLVGGVSMSATPLYLGLMAIAGAYLIKGNLNKK